MTATENSFRCIPIVMTEKKGTYETHDSDGWYYKGRYKNDKLVYRETYRSDGSLGFHLRMDRRRRIYPK